MESAPNRLTDPQKPPSDGDIAAWIGDMPYIFWQQLRQHIEENYPGVFSPEWLYGGRKHGWSLRYKKNKSFCTFIPEKDRFALLIVFGAEERERYEEVKPGLTLRTQNGYESAKTYHDGKWLLLAVDDEPTVRDIELLLAVKRKPKPKKTV